MILVPGGCVLSPVKGISRRSGRPFDLAYKQSRNALFLDGVHNTDRIQGRGITPFFVRRSTYLAFLGHLSLPGRAAPRRSPSGAVDEYVRT